MAVLDVCVRSGSLVWFVFTNIHDERKLRQKSEHRKKTIGQDWKLLRAKKPQQIQRPVRDAAAVFNQRMSSSLSPGTSDEFTRSYCTVKPSITEGKRVTSSKNGNAAKFSELRRRQM